MGVRNVPEKRIKVLARLEHRQVGVQKERNGTAKVHQLLHQPLPPLEQQVKEHPKPELTIIKVLPLTN